jgi:hypothetical protein
MAVRRRLPRIDAWFSIPEEARTHHNTREVEMQFIGIDLHTNRCTSCYRSEGTKDKRTETYELSEAGLEAFFKTLTGET